MHPYDGRVVSNFIRQAIINEAITIFGDGSQTRSFCYRDDLVHGIIDMMDGPDDFIGPVNMGIRMNSRYSTSTGHQAYRFKIKDHQQTSSKR